MMQIDDCLYTEQQIRELEKRAIKNGILARDLMARAGQAAFDWFKKRWSHTHSVVVFCGGGNNGGDGYLFAILAQAAGLNVTVRYATDPSHLRREAANAFELCKKNQVEIKPFDPKENLQADVFVDALLGIGLRNEVKKPIATIIHYLNQSRIPIFSIDIPSGLCADTGTVQGVAIHAASTITFIGIKRGLTTHDGLRCAGEIICHDLNISDEIIISVKPSAIILNWRAYLKKLKPRNKNSHKGDFGHVLVIGGDRGMSGAPRIAALGALRIGAGLVTVATHVEHADVVNAEYPELMSVGIKTEKELLPLFKKATVIVVGPGLGQTKWSQIILNETLKTKLPLVVDADALNLLAKKPLSKNDWILTPHPGEAARLLKTDNKKIQRNRFDAACQIQKKFSGITVLKGAGTIIDNGLQQIVCAHANPGLASGGMGDLLSGMIAGLIAQQMDCYDAVCSAVGLHAAAGDLAVISGARGTIATDLLPYIRQLVNDN